MSNYTDALWREFDALGEAEVRKRLAGQMFGEAKVLVAREWLTHIESSRASATSAATLAEAKAANEFARTANDLAAAANAAADAASASAARSADAAKTNNTIATLALIAAMAAIAISIVGTFIGKHQ